jgi:hypothetical protein
VDQTPKTDAEHLKKKVQLNSPDRLLRRPVELPGGLVVSAERHRGRILVRVETSRVGPNEDQPPVVAEAAQVSEEVL